MNQNTETLNRMGQIAANLARPDVAGNVHVNYIEMDWLLTVAQTAVAELAASNKAEASPVQTEHQMLRVVVQDDGVDGFKFLGYTTPERIPLDEAFIAGFNRAMHATRQMSGELSMMDLGIFDADALD